MTNQRTPSVKVDWRAELRAFRVRVHKPEPCPSPETCDNYSCDVNRSVIKSFERVDDLLAMPEEHMGQATAPSGASWETECRRAWSERDDARREVRALRERTGADVVWSDTVRESADGAERIAIFGCYGYGSQGALHWVSLPNDLKIRSPNGMGAQEILAKYPREVRGGHRTEQGK